MSWVITKQHVGAELFLSLSEHIQDADQAVEWLPGGQMTTPCPVSLGHRWDGLMCHVTLGHCLFPFLRRVRAMTSPMTDVYSSVRAGAPPGL